MSGSLASDPSRASLPSHSTLLAPLSHQQIHQAVRHHEWLLKSFCVSHSSLSPVITLIMALKNCPCDGSASSSSLSLSLTVFAKVLLLGDFHVHSFHFCAEATDTNPCWFSALVVSVVSVGGNGAVTVSFRWLKQLQGLLSSHWHIWRPSFPPAGTKKCWTLWQNNFFQYFTSFSGFYTCSGIRCKHIEGARCPILVHTTPNTKPFWIIQLLGKSLSNVISYLSEHKQDSNAMQKHAGSEQKIPGWFQGQSKEIQKSLKSWLL